MGSYRYEYRGTDWRAQAFSVVVSPRVDSDYSCLWGANEVSRAVNNDLSNETNVWFAASQDNSRPTPRLVVGRKGGGRGLRER